MPEVKNKGGRPHGSTGMNRSTMLLALQRRFPKFDPIVRMVEQAELVREDLEAQAKKHAAQAKRKTAVKPEDYIPPVANQDRALLSSMYERPAKFLVPQLRAMELKPGMGDGDGKITVTFERTAPKARAKKKTGSA